MQNRYEPARKLGSAPWSVRRLAGLRAALKIRQRRVLTSLRRVCRSSPENGSDSPFPAIRNEKIPGRRWCGLHVRNRSRCANADSRCARAASGVHAWHSTGTASHLASPSDPGISIERSVDAAALCIRTDKEPAGYMRSKRVPCFSIATMTDSRADCCVSLEESFVARVGRSACSRSVWLATSRVCSCVA
jgi:hypothetical protein